MNLVLHSPPWLIALLIVALVAAALEDVARFKISNLTCVAVLVGAILAMGLRGFPPGLWQNAVIFAVILIAGTAAFGSGLLGGGDVKLLTAIGLWLDFSTALVVAVAIALAGGLLALLYIGAKMFRRSTAPTTGGSKVPYGLAIVSGALVVFATQLLHQPTDPILDRLKVTRPNG